MLVEDVQLLRCPVDGEHLTLEASVEEQGEVVTGTLRSPSGRTYPVRNGIPRFVEDLGDNASWDFKWTHLDAGRGLNYRIIDEADEAYAVHDIFDRNDHDGRAFEHARARLALDVGCGVGQYTVKLLRDYQPQRIVAIDLTGGVDVFRKVLRERYPELFHKVLIVQGNALALPFADGTFDYVMSLGVLMHTGRTMDAIREVGRVTADGGQVNVWIYASEPVPFEAREEGRSGMRMPLQFVPVAARYSVVWTWIRLFRKLPRSVTLLLLRAFSSRFWLRANTTRGIGRFASLVFPTVQHESYDYRLINNYDGYVNEWSDTWSEHELFPVLRERDLVVLGFSRWRLGVWAVKKAGFYRAYGAGSDSLVAS